MPSSAIKAIFTKTFVAISLINMLGLAGYYAIFVVSTQFLSEVFHEGWSVLLAGALAGLGFGNFQSVAQVSAISMVTRERYAQATSTFYIFFDLGLGLAPYLAGHAAPFVGYDGIYGLNAVVVALCIVWYAVLHVRGSLAKRPSLGQAVDFSKNK